MYEDVGRGLWSISKAGRADWTGNWQAETQKNQGTCEMRLLTAFGAPLRGWCDAEGGKKPTSKGSET